MQTFTNAVVSEAGAGHMAFGFGPHLIRMTADDTGGTYGVLEVDMPAGEGPPLHVHEREEEFFRVLSGRFLFVCGDTSSELSEGGCILLPRGVPHRFQNVGSTTGRLMVIVTPGGFEGFFAAAQDAAMSDVDEIAAGFGLRFVPAISAARAA